MTRTIEIKLTQAELLAHDPDALADLTDADLAEIIDCTLTLDSTETDDTYCEICESELESDSLFVNDGPARYEACLSHFSTELQTKLRAS